MIAREGVVWRVVVAAVDGSAPREVGASMTVWRGADGAPALAGTIGGGALEFAAAQRAVGAADRLDRVPLGPALGQCCGGAVTLLTERWDAARMASGVAPTGDVVAGDVVARPVAGDVVARPVADDVVARSVADGAVSRPMTGDMAVGPVQADVTMRPNAGDVTARPVAGGVVARPAPGGPAAMPLAVARLLDRARASGTPPAPGLVQGWMVEPLTRPIRQVWIYGAGHVGRALVGVIAPLGDVAITWVDTATDRFPAHLPHGVAPLVAVDPARAVAAAPVAAEHLVLTYSHRTDLAICAALLRHGFARAGLIGSATKWARFRSRLRALGFAPEAIARIECPIGDPALGRSPQAIAIGVAADMLRGLDARRQWATG